MPRPSKETVRNQVAKLLQLKNRLTAFEEAYITEIQRALDRNQDLIETQEITVSQIFEARAK